MLAGWKAGRLKPLPFEMHEVIQTADRASHT